eukprot:NODE_260_length_11481_cov_1.187928.p6 type:complete len:303 gc:universal NODE_260_length_11481_cov_1.187928:8765-9673(+)
MIFTTLVSAIDIPPKYTEDTTDPIRFAIPLDTWGWNAMNTPGVLYECVNAKKQVSYRVKTETPMDDSKDFGFGQSGFHYLAFPRLKDVTCSYFVTTLYFTYASGTSESDKKSQMCTKKVEMNLDACELNAQNGATQKPSITAQLMNGKTSEKQSANDTILTMVELKKPENKDLLTTYLKFARAYFPVAANIESDSDLINWLLRNVDAKMQIDYLLMKVIDAQSAAAAPAPPNKAKGGAATAAPKAVPPKKNVKLQKRDSCGPKQLVLDVECADFVTVGNLNAALAFQGNDIYKPTYELTMSQ